MSYQPIIKPQQQPAYEAIDSKRILTVLISHDVCDAHGVLAGMSLLRPAESSPYDVHCVFEIDFPGNPAHERDGMIPGAKRPLDRQFHVLPGSVVERLHEEPVRSSGEHELIRRTPFPVRGRHVCFRQWMIRRAAQG